MIYPNSAQMRLIYLRALDYAQRSIEYTHEFNGWETNNQQDKERKLERILVGLLGQYWLYEVFRLNNVPFLEDYSNSTEPDNMDGIVCGYSYDAKTSRGGVVPPQVASHLRYKNNRPDYYIFLKTSDYELEKAGITPLGIITYQDFWKHCISVPQGEVIPTTNIINRFSETNIIDESHLYPFDEAIHNLYLRCVLNPHWPIFDKKMDTTMHMLRWICERLLFLSDQLKSKDA